MAKDVLSSVHPAYRGTMRNDGAGGGREPKASVRKLTPFGDSAFGVAST